MTTIRDPCSSWSTKKYILAALLGALVTAAVVASISSSLAPAHISFSVMYANITKTFPNQHDPQRYNWYYNLTLVANNTTSRRKEVLFSSLSADIWWSETSWIPADEVDTTTEQKDWLPPGSITLINLGVEGGRYDEAAKGSPPEQEPPNNNQGDKGSSSVVQWPNCRVVVEAKVRFRLGRVPTLPYTVTASCFPVNFEAGFSVPAVQCTS